MGLTGHTMTTANIRDIIGTLNKSLVMTSINDEQTVKRLRVKKGTVSLVPENASHKPIEITGEMDFRTPRVVTNM